MFENVPVIRYRSTNAWESKLINNLMNDFRFKLIFYLGNKEGNKLLHVEKAF